MPKKTVDSVVTDIAPCGLLCSRCDCYIAKTCMGCYTESQRSEWECPVLSGKPFPENQELIACMNEKDVEQCGDCRLFEGCQIYEAMLMKCPFIKPVYELKSGFAYLVKERKPKLSAKIFRDAVHFGATGLCITRQHRKNLKKTLGDIKVEKFWLTSIEGKGNIDPTNLGIISDTINKFIKKNKDAVVLMDGFELLITHNDFPGVLRMIDHVIEQCMQNNAALIIPLDQRTLDKKELALLERTMEVLEG